MIATCSPHCMKMSQFFQCVRRYDTALLTCTGKKSDKILLPADYKVYVVGNIIISCPLKFPDCGSVLSRVMPDFVDCRPVCRVTRPCFVKLSPPLHAVRRLSPVFASSMSIIAHSAKMRKTWKAKKSLSRKTYVRSESNAYKLKKITPLSVRRIA